MKSIKITYWTSTGFLFLFEGMMPLTALLFSYASVTAGSVHLGYPVYFAYTLVAFKVIGSFLLIIPNLPRPVKEWTYAGFAFNFISASISHFIIDGLGFVSFFPLIILGILVLSYLNYFKVYKSEETKYLKSDELKLSTQ